MYDRSRFYGRDGRDCPSGDWMDRIRGDADDCCKRGPTGATETLVYTQLRLSYGTTDIIQIKDN